MNSAAWLLEHLSDRDISFIVHALVTRRSDHDHICDLLRDKPDLIGIMLDDPQLYARITDGTAIGQVSPHLLFSVLMRQVRRELQGVAHTMDYAPQGRVPVFDAGELRGLLDDAARRDYVVDLLASFTRASRDAGGGPETRGEAQAAVDPTWVASDERSYRWRFSEVDLAALDRLRSLVDERDRFAVERRIGDLALFLAGTCAHEENRRVLVEAAQQAKVGTASSTLPELLEALEGKARDAYQNAARHPIARATHADGTLAAMAESVHPARKVLNHLSERHLDPLREVWFQTPLLEAGR